MNTTIILKINQDTKSVEIVDPLDRPIQIGTIINGDIWITEEEVINLDSVQEHIEKTIEEETEELNEEITRLWKMLNEKAEQIEEMENLNKQRDDEIERLKQVNRELEGDLDYAQSQARKYKRQASER